MKCVLGWRLGGSLGDLRFFCVKQASIQTLTSDLHRLLARSKLAQATKTYTEDWSRCMSPPKQAGHRRRRYSLGRVRGKGSGNGKRGLGVRERERLRGARLVDVDGVGDSDHPEDVDRDRAAGRRPAWRPRGVARGVAERGVAGGSSACPDDTGSAL